MSDQSQGPGWWQASDLRWYPPHSVPNYGPPALPPPTGGSSGTKTGLIVVGFIVGAMILLGVVAGVVVFAVGGRTSSAEVAACRIEAQTIRVAEAASKAQRTTAENPTPGYVSLEELVAEQMLRRVPTTHRVVLDGPSGAASSFRLEKAGRCVDADYTP